MDKRAKRKNRTGIVVSTKMDKTAVVEVERRFPHPFYKKVTRMSTKLKAHDAKNECQLGDLVEIMETRPISKDKRWRLVKIMGRTQVSKHELPKDTDKRIERKEQAKEQAVDPAGE